MKDYKKQELSEMSITAVKILLCVMLLFGIFVFVYYGLINRGYETDKEEISFVNDWIITYSKEGDQTLKTILPKNIKDNEYIFFETRKDVSVYINNDLRKDFIEARDVNIPGGSFKRFLMSVPLNEADSGAVLMIVRHSDQDIDRGAPELIIGTHSAVVGYLFRSVGLVFILSVIVLIFSFVSFVVSIVLRLMYKQRIDMTYGALGIFIIAAWLITDSSLFPFVFGVYHVNGLLSFLLCLMIPLGLIIYLSSILRGRYRRCMAAAIVIAILNAVVWPFLHFSGILDFYYMVDIANAVLVILVVAGIAILTIDALKGNIDDYRYTVIGFLGFLAACLFELMNILLAGSIIKDAVPMVMGLGFLLTFIVIQQVNDLRKMNEEKQHAIDISEAKTRFLASMSHEIRTPINAILGMNEMILRENNDKTIDEYSKNIKTSGKMLLMLVNDVLDFTKIEAGKLEFKEAEFSMADMLYDVLSLIKERAEEKSIGLNTEIREEVPDELISDEFRLRQILVNLLNNAVKYTEKGSITLSLGGKYTDDGYELMLCVKDTGKGIRKEDQEHLFEAFSRADIRENINIEGTGLGLAIVKSIVDSMNGELGVESVYGVGSKFWVKLPVKYKDKEPLKKDFMESRKDKAAETGTCSFTAPDAKILAVDDNRSNLTIIKLFLKRNLIVPDLCSTGERAIELCKEKKYDLILLDHMMPKPDGIETLHIIKSSDSSLNKDTKAIVLTANALAGSRQMYMKEGFDDYLTKPLDSGLLEETVKNMLPAEKVMAAAVQPAVQTSLSLRDRLTAVGGLDYDTALKYSAGDEEMLLEIIGDVADGCDDHVKKMRKSLEEKDIQAYRIEAHTIKSTMLTVGLKEFSERAKKHEFAARDNDTDFVFGDADAFINEYIEICRKLKDI